MKIYHIYILLCLASFASRCVLEILPHYCIYCTLYIFNCCIVFHCKNLSQFICSFYCGSEFQQFLCFCHYGTAMNIFVHVFSKDKYTFLLGICLGVELPCYRVCVQVYVASTDAKHICTKFHSPGSVMRVCLFPLSPLCVCSIITLQLCFVFP